MAKVERGVVRSAKGSSREPLPSKCGSTQNMAAYIKVIVRVRPLNEKEKEANSRVAVDVIDEKMLVFDPKEETRPFFYQGVRQPSKNIMKRANKELKFVFDTVCRQNATNQDVFEITTKDMLMSLMEGYNCSVFAYGATGAGKTFTMIGSKMDPGITYLTMEHLFSIINSYEQDREFEIGVSYLEVYNENVFDLLKPSTSPLQLREDPNYGVMVAGLMINEIKTARELLQMLENGNKNRTQHPTDANAESSRSHAVFQVYVKMRSKMSSQTRVVKLSMIDLAGSERASATGCVGDRFKEGANINRSLLSLGNCINQLADGNKHIPYRDSKLTRLLKDSLGGNCKTVMIANVSPSSLSYEDTYNTLKYAARANKIQLSIKKNIVDGATRISQYVKIVEELKKKVKELEAKLSLSNVQPEKYKKTEQAKAKVTEWRQRLTADQKALSSDERALSALLVRQRVLTLRRRLRARALQHAARLAHRSSDHDMQQMCDEDIPRQERAADNFMKQSVQLDINIQASWNKWNESNSRLRTACEQALAECPDLQDFIDNIHLQIELRQARASDNMRMKLLSIQNEEINTSNEYITDMPDMLRKLYLTLKGYDKAPPALTSEYLDIMKKAKAAKTITWSDKESDVDSTDHHFRFITTLQYDKPTTTPDFNLTCVKKENENLTDSDDLCDIENRDPVETSARKRKGTPIKLVNDDTIVIDDSFEAMDVTRNLNSAKKVKKMVNIALDVENIDKDVIDPNNLNSTFVLAEKMGAPKVPFKFEGFKTENNSQPIKRGLDDRTNTMQRTITFNENKARVVKPVVGKALPFRRPPPPAVVPRATAGFGSSVSRDGTPLQRNIQVNGGGVILTQKAVGFKAVKARDRYQNHPYSRPPAPASR